MKYIMVLALFLAPLFVSINTGIPNEVKAFVIDIRAKTVSNTDIVTKHLCVDDNERTKAERRKILYLQIDEIRAKLTDQKSNEFEILPYKSLSSNQKLLILDSINQDNIFAIRSKQNLLFFIWFKNGKIASFSTMNKSGKRFFLEICG